MPRSKSNKKIGGFIAGVVTACAIAVFVIAVIGTTSNMAEAQKENGNVSENIQLVEDFIAAFNAKDVDKIMAIFGDDPVYHNMPGPPVKGAGPVRKLVESFVAPADKVDWEILNIAESGDTVLAERDDRFVIGGKDVSLPCNGAFEIKDGRIAVWRDYFDFATWQRQMQ